MAIELKMPALSPTMEEGTLAKWLKQEGDEIVAGDIIAEIETDKATMEVEAVDEGTLAAILVPEGTENVKVNAVIARLAEEGESVDDVDDSPADEGEKESKAQTEAKDAPTTEGDGDSSDQGSEDEGASAPPEPEEETLTDPDVPEGTDGLREAFGRPPAGGLRESPDSY